VGIAERGTAAVLAPGHQAWHFVGVQAVNAAAFAGVDPSRPADSLRDVYPALVAARPGAVRVWPADATFHDIGTPADYLDTALRLAAREGVAADRGPGTVVAPTARVTDSVLWDRVTIGPGATVARCIVADDVVVPAGASCVGQVVTRDGAVPL
jgi:NDP-sugar pyrophosphorylase family protein